MPDVSGHSCDSPASSLWNAGELIHREPLNSTSLDSATAFAVWFILFFLAFVTLIYYAIIRFIT
jgi:hypothetical protein